MLKSDWLFGCCTTVKVTVEVKERRIKLLQMNLEGQDMDFLRLQEIFSLRNQNPATPLILIGVLSHIQLIFTSATLTTKSQLHVMIFTLL